MIRPEVEAVVFDLGNVLVGWDRRLLFEKLIDDPAELDRFLDEVLTLDVNAELDRGVPLAEVTAALVARFPADQGLIEAFGDRWTETLGPIINGSVAIVEELAAMPVRLFVLSNFGRDTFALTEPHLPFLTHFDDVVISGREGIVKPDPAIFRLLCSRHGVTPARTVFIDDDEANIAVAAELGFQTVHFESPGRLRAALVELGLDLAS